VVELIFRDITANFKWFDVLDIAIAFFIIYQLLSLIKGTRVLQVLTGLVLVGLLYVVSVTLGLSTVNEMLSRFFNYLFIIIIIVFQDDIRKMLAKMGKTPFFGMKISQKSDEELVEQLVKSAVALSRKRIGALMVLERAIGLSDSIEVGVKLDTNVNSELMLSIFSTESPIHDGAVVIKEGRVTAAGCFLPLTRNTNVEKSLGTRHRAAIGLTENTDAVVIVVSEEQREISIAKDGELIRELDSPALRKHLNDILGVKGVSTDAN
jgi:diadenylate cyclase